MKFGSLSITTTDGRTREYPIDLPSLVIGRADGNSIVVDDLSVARRHARVTVDSGRLLVEDLGAATGTFVDGQRIPPNTPSLVESGQDVRLGDVEVRYTAPVAVQPEKLTPPTTAAMPAGAPESSPSLGLPPGIRAALMVPPEPVEAGGTALLAELRIQNRSHVVDELAIEVRDLPADWLTLSSSSVVLRPGDETTVSIAVLPPRHADSRAGEYDFSVVVTSGESGREIVAAGQLRLLPFEATELSLHPIRSKKNFQLIAHNGGNSFATYAISAIDDEEAFRYEFAAPSLELPAGQDTRVPFRVVPKKRKLFGPAMPQPFTVLAKPANGAGEVAQVQGQLAISPPLEPLKRPAMFAMILMVVVIGALAFLLLRPNNSTVSAAGTEAAYAGVHLCDKDTGKSDAPVTPTPTQAQAPAGTSGSGAPYFAQNDPRWGNDEYAMAKDPQFGPDWCGVTIAQCGCAMTSVTTVMALYDILKMPDGSDLTPETVNAWFDGNATKTARGWVSQGYIYGDVIWTAANQLSGEIHKIDPSSPTIRFLRAGTGSDEEIRSELKAGRPVVLEVPGHWISAVGLDGDKILINDPYYRDRKTLDAYAGKVKSSILFEKSDDLSAVVITVPASERVRVTDKAGNVVGTLDTGSAADAAANAKNQIPGASYSARTGWRDPTCIASPPPAGSGTNQIVLPGSRDDYKIEVLETAGGPTSVAIHTYDKTGTPSVKTIDNNNGDSVVAQVNYDPAKTEPQVTVLAEKPVSDSSSDRAAGAKSPTVTTTTTAEATPTVAPTATPVPSGPVTTIMSTSSAPGTKVVNIASSQGFAVGDIIRFSPGASNEEDNTIVGFGSFILTAPLKFAHSAGEIIVRVAGVPGGGGAPPPVSNPQLEPPGAVALACTPIYSSAPRSATLICTITVTGTYTTTRWSIDGRVQSAFTGQTVLLSVFSQDTTVAIAATACNITMCASDAATVAIRFPTAPEAQTTATPEPTNPVTPTAPPIAIGVAANCSVNFTSDIDLSKALANLSCDPKSLPKDFSSITWTAPGFIPDNNLTRTTAPFTASAPQTKLAPGSDGNAIVPIGATVCSVNSGGSPTCTVAPPTNVVIPYATTTLSILPSEARLDTNVSLFAVVKAPAGVIPNGGVVRFEDVTDPDNPKAIGLDVKIQQIGGIAFAQLNFHAGSAPLDVVTNLAATPPVPPRQIRAVYGGASNIFGSQSDDVGLTLDPPVPDICNSIDDNGDGRFDETCALPSAAAPQKDVGSGTFLTGIGLSGAGSVPLNGSDATTNGLQVAPGADFTLSLSAQLKTAPADSDPYCANCKRQVYIGIGENSASVPRVNETGPVCVMDRSLSDNTTSALALPDVQLKAPTTPGMYYVRATSSVQQSCGQPDVGGPEASIARIIVKGDTQVTAPVKDSGAPDPQLGTRIRMTSLVTSDQPGKPIGFVAFCDGSVTPSPANACVGGNLLAVVPVTDTADHTGRQAVLDLDTAVLFANQTNTPFIPAAGNHNFTAHFLDGGSYPNPFYTTSDSGPGVLNVLPAPASTTAKLVFGSNPTSLGSTITLSVVVRSGPYGDFGGHVVFCDDSVPANPAPADASSVPCGLATQLTDTSSGSSFPVSGSDVGIGSMAFDTTQLYKDVDRPNPIFVHNIRAKYFGAGNYGDSENSDGLTVTPSVTNVALTRSTGVAVPLGRDVGGLEAQVSSGVFGSYSGNVQFRVGGTILGTAAVDTSGHASCADCDTTNLYTATPAISPLVNTTHIIQAYYMGAGNYGGSQASPPLGVPVTPSTTSIVVSVPQEANPALGDGVTFKGDITATDFGLMNGTIEFRSGANLLCTATITNATISATPPSVSAASPAQGCDTAKFYDLLTSPHPISVPAAVSAHFIPAAGSLYASADSATEAVTLRPAPSSVSVSLDVTTAVLGAVTPVALTANLGGVAGPGEPFGPLSGDVQFKVDGAIWGTPQPVSGHTATLALDTADLYTSGAALVGPHSITAIYTAGSTSNYQDSTESAPTGLTLSPAVSSVTVGLSQPSVALGGNVTALTATVADGTNPSPRFGAFAGTVQFKRDGTNIGSPVTVASNVATLPNFDTTAFYNPLSPASPIGTHSITAEYTSVGSPNYGNSPESASAVLTLTPAGTSIAVTVPSSSDVALGDSATVKADITAPTFGNLSGHVDFTDDHDVLFCSTRVSGPPTGTPAVVSKSIGCDTTNLYAPPTALNPLGTRKLSAHFEPDTGSSYGVSDSTATADLKIKAANPTMTSPYPNPVSVPLGDSVTLTVSIRDGTNATPRFGAFGNVTFKVDSTDLTPVAVAPDGTATTTFDTDSFSSGAIGAHMITATYAATGNYGAAATPSAPVVSFTVTAATPTIALTPTSATALSGATVTFRVTVSGSFGTPAGSVTLRNKTDDSVVGSTATLSGGTASFTPTTGPIGTYQIYADYTAQSGGNYANGNNKSTPSTVTVVAPTVSFSAPTGTVFVGTPVVLTATVSCPACTPTTVPNGTIQFMEGTSIGSGSFTSGSGTANVTFSAAGTHSIVAHYVSGSVTGDSAPVDIAVSLRATRTVLSASPSGPYHVGDTISVIALTTCPLCSAPGASVGTATITQTSPASPLLSGGPVTVAGDYVFNASFAATGTYEASSDNVFTVTVVKTGTTVAMNGLPASVPQGTATTLTATVAPDVSRGALTGTVVFKDNGTAISGTVTFAGGIASLPLNTAAMSKTGHTITATYSGDGAYLGATSPGATLTVT